MPGLSSGPMVANRFALRRVASNTSSDLMPKPSSQSRANSINARLLSRLVVSKPTSLRIIATGDSVFIVSLCPSADRPRQSALAFRPRLARELLLHHPLGEIMLGVEQQGE